VDEVLMSIIEAVQETDVIEVKPEVKIQSSSPSPGISIAPRSVVQVPIPDDGSTDSGEVAVVVSMIPTDEEVNEGEDEESGHGDDEEEKDEINHEKLPRSSVHTHSPGRRQHTSAVWTHLRHIDKHDVSGHEMKDHSVKFGYLSMMSVTTLGTLNTESFCECVLSCVKLVVSDLHVCLKTEEIHMLVMLRMNHEFMEYMRATYPDTPGPLSEFKGTDTYVCTRGGVESLDDDEDDQ